MPYYNKKEYPKQIWVSQIPEREVSLLRENLARNKTNYICINSKKRKPVINCQSSGAEISFSIFESVSLDLARDVDVPAIAYQKPETDTFLHADMVVEGSRKSI